MKKNKRGKSKPPGKRKSAYSQIEPIQPENLTVEKLGKYSSPKLLVTAMLLNKKSKRERNKEKKQAMMVKAGYIAQLLQGRKNNPELACVKE